MKWKPATIAQWTCLAVALIVAALLLPRIGHGRMTLLLASHVLAVVTGYVMMFVVGGLGICHLIGNWLGKSGSGQRHAFERATVRLATIAGALTVAGTILGMFWAKENWGRYWAWDPKEVGAVLVIACAGAIGAMRRVSRNQNAIAFASVIGNIATAWAWFGTVGTVNRDGLIIGTVNASPLLIAFTASQGILLAATLLTVKRHASTESA